MRTFFYIYKDGMDEIINVNLQRHASIHDAY
jgi:hypothetical protein